MKIHKYIHSCLVFELDGYKLLFDPGSFTFIDDFVKPEDFGDVQSIIITHVHADHYYPENIKKILAINPVPVYTNDEASKALTADGINHRVWQDGVHYLGPFKLQSLTAAHEAILNNPLPLMTAFVINDKVLHPVDSMDDALLKYTGMELLIMVSMAPFASEPRIAAFADKLAPKQILPVHDGYAKDFFVEQRYAAYKKHFEHAGTTFHSALFPGYTATI